MAATLQYFVNGIVFSSIIVLGSVGLAIVYSIADFANFAHGDTMTIGAYTALVAFGPLAAVQADVLGLPLGFFLALAVGMAVAAVVAVGTELLIYRPLDVDSLGLLITSIGVAFVYRALVRWRFGTQFQSFGIEQSGPMPFFQDALGVAITERHLVMVVVATVLVISLHVLLQYTTLGRKMRAMADNPDLARVSGIRTGRVKLATWAIGAGLAGAGGVFLGLFNQLNPRMGFAILLVIFAAVILGGIDSVYGAMLGGVVIGMVTRLTPLLRDFGIPLGNEYSTALAFVIMVVILLVRPRGIAGGEPT
jgi:branched-chain amino acid transport system permease protein